jgi:hypothetical protein
MSKRDNHKYHLDKIICGKYIGEYVSHARWVIREGIWRPNGMESKLCDILAYYNPDNCSAIELKPSWKYEIMALKQIESAEKMLRDEFDIPSKSVQKKIVVYKNNELEWRIYD